MRVIFMGTPDFSVPALEKLSAEHEVIAVVTQPDKPKGRSGKLIACPVKEKALELGLRYSSRIGQEMRLLFPKLKRLTRI